MNTAANLLVILIFLAGFYTFLGLICGIVEKAGELLAKPRQRRRVRRSMRHRTPRWGVATGKVGARVPRPLGVTASEDAMNRRRYVSPKAPAFGADWKNRSADLRGAAFP